MARRPAVIDKRTMTRSHARERVVAREPSRARSWVGLTIVACLPGIRIPQSLLSAYSLDKSVKVQECYESTVVSHKNGCEPRLPPTLRHKGEFVYEYRR